MKHSISFKSITLIIGLLLLISLIVVAGGGSASLTAHAATNKYSNVLDDLSKDENFNPSDYQIGLDGKPAVEVIQVAESSDNEVFIYTHSSTSDLFIATSINISTEIGDNLKYIKYKLTILSHYGAFYKYKVEGLNVSSANKRYYDISSIFRSWSLYWDGTPSNSNIINEVAFAVGRRFTAETVDGEVKYSGDKTDVVVITDKYLGYIDYPRGFQLFKDSHCYGHYVAFSTDWDMDTLDEVEISFVVQPKPVYSQGWPWPDIEYKEDPVPMTITWTSDDYATNAPVGLFVNLHKELRIQTASEFIASENLNEGPLGEVKNKQWVLRYYESAYTVESLGGSTMTYSEEVSEVTLLRFKFHKGGKAYNLGVVDNVSSPDPSAPPDNDGNQDDYKMGFWEYIWYCLKQFFTGQANKMEAAVAIIAILVVLVLIPVITLVLSLIFPAFGQVLKVIFKGIWTAIKWLFIGLWWLISLPFRLIANAVQNRKDRPKKTQTRKKSRK